MIQFVYIVFRIKVCKTLMSDTDVREYCLIIVMIFPTVNVGSDITCIYRVSYGNWLVIDYKTVCIEYSMKDVSKIEEKKYLNQVN